MRAAGTRPSEDANLALLRVEIGGQLLLGARHHPKRPDRRDATIPGPLRVLREREQIGASCTQLVGVLFVFGVPRTRGELDDALEGGLRVRLVLARRRLDEER